MEINGISSGLKYLIDQPQTVSQEKVSFGEVLQEKLNEVNTQQLQADELTRSYIAGDNIELHDVMLAAEQANLSLQLTVQVKNKMVEAYQEIARMQV